MSNHLRQPLDELRQAITADGIVDAQEVVQVRERIYADGIVDREEAGFLFDINDAVSGNANAAGWQELFVDAICDYVLKDEASPGAVDDAEATWLMERIQRDRKLDDAERALIRTLQRRATSLSEKLNQILAS